MAVRIQIRRGTASEWEAANPILMEGEIGIETDTFQFKVGNGFDDWDTLPYSVGFPDHEWDGTHLRFRNPDGTWGDWVDLSFEPFRLGNTSDFTATPVADYNIELTWEDPDDAIIDGVTVAEWAGTKVVRKEGSYPTGPSDGEEVVDSTTRNQYKSTPYTDTGLSEDTKYYYMAFPYTTQGVYTINDVNRDSATTIDKNPQDPPPAPDVTDITDTEATVTGDEEGVGDTQVRLNDGSWESNGHTFTGLDPETEYTAYARYGETETHFASDPSDGETFTTLPEAHGASTPVAENEFAKYYGTIESSDGKTEEDRENHFYQITGGSEGAPDAGYEDFNGDNFCHYFGIASSDTWSTQNSNTDWVKYEWARKYGSEGIGEDRRCFTPKKPFGYDGNWRDLYAAGIVYGDGLEAGEEGAEHHNREMSGHEGYSEGDLTDKVRQDKWIEIDGVAYTVRLMEGGPEGNNDSNEPTGDSAGYGASEWNTILYSLCDCSPEGHQGEDYADDDPERDTADYKWEEWSNDDLGIGGQSDPNGRRTWCQETSVDEESYRRVTRGDHSVVYFSAPPSALTHANNGFRPVLELR